jgi:glycosyltransferase involved in cell wall biosynthesis
VEDADITIGFFRHLRPWYGAHYIPLIVRLVIKNTNAKVKFVLAGDADPEYMKLLYELILRLDLRTSVIYLGKIPRTQMPLAYQAVDIVINTSLIDGMPSSTPEAMALGTIPVASSVGGVPEIIGDCPAKKFLFKSGDANDLIEKLRILALQSKERVLDLAMKCRDHVGEMFNKENIERKVIEAFKKL